jgi:hypothetical protein
MVTETIKELEAARSKVAALEAALAKKNKALTSLHTKHGFANIDDFISALKDANRGGRGPGRRASAPAAAAPSSGSKKRSKRAKITPEMKQELKSLVGQGKTGAVIAKTLGISLPSVQNIKKELGLVQARK